MSYTAQEGHVGLALQGAEGVYDEATQFLYVTEISLEPDDNLIVPDPEIGTGRDITEAYPGGIKWSGSISFNLRPEALGMLLLGAFGSVSSNTVGAVTTHTFTPANTLPLLSIEKAVSDGLEVFGYTDVKVNSLRIECAAGEIATGTCEVIATKETSDIAASTPVFEDAPIFTFAGGQVKVDTVVASVKAVSFELNNNIQDDDYRIGSRYLGTLTPKRRELTASIDVVPEDSDEYKKAVYGASNLTEAANTQPVYTGSLEILFESLTGQVIPTTSTKYSLKIEVPEAIFKSAPIPTSGDEMIVQSIEMLPVKGAGNIATATLINSTPSYTAVSS
jgi:hypothetical protein